MTRRRGIFGTLNYWFFGDDRKALRRRARRMKLRRGRY